MTPCTSCGRMPQQDGTATHHLGCRARLRESAPAVVEPGSGGALCAFDGCSQPRKMWSGRGARPKFCAAGHKKEK